MNNQIDTSIPVLTEIIHFDTASINTDTAEQAILSALADNLDEEKWQHLEQTLRENILRQVLSRVDFVLEHRVRDSLADVLQTAVESLAVEIRAGLHKTMEEVITRAITQEITKAKITK